MTDLDKLIAAVEAGGQQDNVGGDFLPGPIFAAIPAGVFSVQQITDCLAAYHGSLDAALRLHEALLPGWVWTATGDYASVSNANGENWRTSQHYSAFNATPARAWLLAILRALKAKGDA